MAPAVHSPRGSLEGTPLLSPVDSEAFAPLPSGVEEKKKKPWVYLVVLVFLLVAIVDVGAFLAEAPKTRVYEANLCLRYYSENDPSKIQPGGSVPEELCKIDEVQQRLANIMGWQETFDAIPSILLAVPFGTLADKVGRKWVFVGSLVGLQLNMCWILLICWMRSLPLQLTWLSSAFFLVGGGPIVASAIGLTMVADVVPPEKRTSVFLWLSAGVLIAELIAPIISAQLMKKGDWLPLLLALAIQQVGVFIALPFPETLHLRDLPEPRDPDEHPEIELRAVEGGSGSHFALKAQLRNFKDALAFLRRDRTVALVIFTFLGNRLGRQALQLLIRYASKRYGWKIQKAAYLLSFRAATNLLALTIFVPGINYILLHFLHLPAHWADLWIARGSAILTTVSFLIMGVAAHPVLLILGLLVFNLGTGYNAAMRSTSLHVVGGQSSPDVGRLFAVVAIMESIGAMIAGPVLAHIFEWGIEMGEPWIGAPYLASALVCAAVAGVTFVISFKEHDELVLYEEVGEEEYDDEEEEEGRGRRHLD